MSVNEKKLVEIIASSLLWQPRAVVVEWCDTLRKDVSEECANYLLEIWERDSSGNWV